MPTQSGELYHGHEIPTRYAKVGMEEVCIDWKMLELDIHGGAGERIVAEAIHGLQHPKRK